MGGIKAALFLMLFSCSLPCLKVSYNAYIWSLREEMMDIVSVFRFPGTLRCVASAPEEVLGSCGWLLHGGADSCLHVPVQKRVWAFQTDHGHVRGWVRLCELLLT